MTAKNSMIKAVNQVPVFPRFQFLQEQAKGEGRPSARSKRKSAITRKGFTNFCRKRRIAKTTHLPFYPNEAIKIGHEPYATRLTFCTIQEIKPTLCERLIYRGFQGYR